jgi:hypothetical protein
MTSEERFTRIENALGALAESQVQNEGRLGRIEQSLERHIEFVGSNMDRLLSQMATLQAQVAETSKQVGRTAAAQEVTETAIQELIRRMGRIDGGN